MTAIDTILGAVTLNEVEPEIPPRLAEMFVVPAAAPNTIPEALTVATFVEDEPQLTSAVKSALLPSL